MYGMLFSWIKPINDVTENRLMATSLAVTVVNLGIGAVSKIPAENIPASMGKYVDADAILFKLLVIGANTSVLGLLVYQYTLFLYQYLKEWRKNPHWSFSCCLALLLPLNDLQGEIRGLVGTNVLSSQLQSGEFEKPTAAVLSAVKESGAIDVTLEEGDQGDYDTTVVGDESCQVAEYSDTRCHQGTQTELRLLSKPDIVSHVSMSKQESEYNPFKMHV
ncbi:hypothetical protein ACROYT_G024724 [Oculina patagonica]